MVYFNFLINNISEDDYNILKIRTFHEPSPFLSLLLPSFQTYPKEEKSVTCEGLIICLVSMVQT